MRKLLILVLLALTVTIQADQLGVNEHTGAMVPLDLKFLDEEGKEVSLKQMMDGKPTMITLNYYRCAGICGPQLADMAKMLTKLDLIENEDYKVLTISFAEDEPVSLAKKKRAAYLSSIRRPFNKDAWHFLIGENNSSGILADKVGFTFKKDITKEGLVSYIHPGTLIMLSPKGKVTRYLNGIGQLPFDVKMAVIEAGEGKVGPTIAKKLLFCFAYDPKGKTYIFKWEKVAGVVMTLLMLSFFAYLIMTSRRKEDENHQDKGDN